MIPTVLLDTAKTPDGRELRLYRHDRDFTIKIGTVELMSSRSHGSEDELARLAYKGMSKQADPKVLIGGLGMGFTLRAALERLPRGAQVTVAEIVPAVVEWNRTLLADLARRPLEDPRVRLVEADVAKLLAGARDEYHAILLDVDNGPQGLTSRDNDWLYSYKGLYAVLAALYPEGVLAVWSARRDDRFAGRLRAVGYRVEEHDVRAHAGKGAHHLVWIAKKPGESPKPEPGSRRAAGDESRSPGKGGRQGNRSKFSGNRSRRAGEGKPFYPPKKSRSSRRPKPPRRPL